MIISMIINFNKKVVIDNLTQMVKAEYQIINVENALIVDPDNTLKLPGEPDKFFFNSKENTTL